MSAARMASALPHVVCPMSVSGRFREYCVTTPPFLCVWLEEVGMFGESEREDSLNKQEKNYNLWL